MKRLAVCLLSIILFTAALYAEDGFEGPEKPANRRAAGFKTILLGEGNGSSSYQQQKDISKIGILFSAVVPGTGQFYAKSWIKGVLFLGLETAFIVVALKSSAKGQDFEDQFHEFADTYWSEVDWHNAYIEGTDPSTHSLPDTKTQQYYEMIGKYDQFMKGWDDWVEGGPDLTVHRDEYETMRHNSNIEFKRASYCAMGILANHLISALDAAFTIRKKNKVNAGLRVSMMRTRDDWVPALNLSAAW